MKVVIDVNVWVSGFLWGGVPAQILQQSISTRVEIGEQLIPQLRDQNDVKILATAIVSEAQVLITGDLDLLVLNPFEAIEILTPSDFQRNYFGVDEQ